MSAGQACQLPAAGHQYQAPWCSRLERLDLSGGSGVVQQKVRLLPLENPFNNVYEIAP